FRPHCQRASHSNDSALGIAGAGSAPSALPNFSRPVTSQVALECKAAGAPERGPAFKEWVPRLRQEHEVWAVQVNPQARRFQRRWRGRLRGRPPTLLARPFLRDRRNERLKIGQVVKREPTWWRRPTDRHVSRVRSLLSVQEALMKYKRCERCLLYPV